MKKTLMNFSQISISLVLAIILPLILNNYLNANTTYIPIIIFTLFTNFLFMVKKYYNGKIKKTSLILLYIIFSISALLLYINIIVIPAPVYGSWFMKIPVQSRGGSIAKLFVYGAVYFSACISGLIYNNRYLLPTSGLFFTYSLLLLILFQNQTFFVISVISIIVIILIFIITGWQKYIKVLSSSLILLIFVMAISFTLTTLTKTNKELIFYFYFPENIKKFLLHNLPEKTFFSSTVGYGFAFDSQKLGQKPALHNKPLFRIKTKSRFPIYLRTQIFDKYYQNSWQVSFKKNQPIATKKQPYFKNQAPNKTIPAENIIKITCLLDYFSIIPHTLSTKSIYLTGKNYFKLISADFKTGFTLLTPLLYQDTIIINQEPDITKKIKIDRSFFNMLEKKINRKIRIQFYEDKKLNLEKYLNLPANLPLSVKKIANSLNKSRIPEWKKLLNIYQYLRINFHYTLDTVPPSTNQDFVEDFLVSKKKGNAQHFATAFIILARLNKIPARYVTGLLVPPSPDGQSQVITGFNIHAWAEVYLTGLGWTLIETTPLGDSNFYKEYTQNGNNLTTAQLSALTGKKFKTESPAKKFNINIHLIKQLSIIILLIITLIYFIRFLFLKWKYRSHLKGKKRKIQKLVSKIVKHASKRNIPHPENIGWVKWGFFLKSIYSNKIMEINCIILIINKTFYSDYIPIIKDLKLLKKCVKDIKN